MNRVKKEYSKGRTGSDRAGVGGLHKNTDSNGGEHSL